MIVGGVGKCKWYLDSYAFIIQKDALNIICFAIHSFAHSGSHNSLIVARLSDVSRSQPMGLRCDKGRVMVESMV